jgi:hypothetical protein
MKKLVMIIAATMASGTAMANGPVFQGNLGYTDNKSHISVTDDSDNNTVDVYQFSIPTTTADNRSKVFVENNSNVNEIKTLQKGQMHRSAVKVKNNSSNNTLTTKQFGYMQKSKITVKGDSDRNTVDVIQKYDHNESLVKIKGNANNNTVYLKQDGSYNDSDIRITKGDRNMVYGLQEGSHNIIDVDILGDGADNNYVDIKQYADEAKARVLIDDEYVGGTTGNHAYITQTGLDYSFIEVTAGSHGNTLTNLQL